MCTTAGQQRSGGADRAHLRAAARACLPSSLPRKCVFPEAHVRRILNRVHAGAERPRDSEPERGSQRPTRRQMHSSPRRMMLRHSHACSRPDCAFGTRSLGLTERGSLAGPGPKLTTFLGASMVLRGTRGELAGENWLHGLRESVAGADPRPLSRA